MATVTLNFGPEVSRFILAAATGTAREVAAFGTRGDGKTWGALGAMITHATEHQKAGFPLPTRWAGVTDTFQSHREKTHDSLLAPGWGGVWVLKDDGHVASCVVDGQELVRLRLFGIEDQGAFNRLRMECHGLWFEEPAPALAISSGISEDAWTLGLTSQRLPSHAHPAILTTNYPDEEHWTWERFVQREHPGTAYFRIPPGERATQADRAEWARALSANPSLARRLLEGEPGMVLLGAQVAEGFNERAHVVKVVKPERGATVWIGQDGGLTPTSVVGQRVGPWRRVLASLTSEHDGIRQHFRGLVIPWLMEHTPWALEAPEALRVIYDPSMNTDGEDDTEHSPLKAMRRELAAIYKPGPVDYPSRLQPMFDLFHTMHDGQASLQIDQAQGRGLIRALKGGWHYATDPNGRQRSDKPEKTHPDSDYGDAFTYMVSDMSPRVERKPQTQTKARVDYDPYNYHRAAPKRALTGLR